MSNTQIRGIVDQLFLPSVAALVAGAMLIGLLSIRPHRSEASFAGNNVSITTLRKEADEIRLAYGRLRQGGCTEAETSFSDHSFAPPSRTVAGESATTGQKRCEVFGPGPGSATYHAPPREILDRTFVGSSGFGQWHISLDNDIGGLGTQPCSFPANFRQCNDVIAFVPYVTEPACRAIDAAEKILISPTEPIPGANPGGVINLRDYAGEIIGQQMISGLFYGRTAGCFKLQKIWFGTGASPVLEVDHPTYAYFRLIACR